MEGEQALPLRNLFNADVQVDTDVRVVVVY